MLTSITNVPRDYAWGSPTLLAELQGREPDGRPEAEVWFGDHPEDPADLRDGRTLDEVTGGRLPFLLKLLAAEAPLSIQVHPTKAKAEAGFAREVKVRDQLGRNYRDQNHKPELLVALSDRFIALVGIAPVDRITRFLTSLGEGARPLRDEVLAHPSALGDVIAGLLRDETPAIREGLEHALRQEPANEFVAARRVLADIAARYPGDPGVAVAALMNVVELTAGQGVFLRAGLLHSYVRGLGVEVMAASDNVLRGGLTPKRIDIEELVFVLDDTPGNVQILEPDKGPVTSYTVDVPDFALERLTLVETQITVPVQGAAIVLATAGSVSVSDGDVSAGVPVGEAVLVQDSPSVVVSGAGQAFVAHSNLR